MDKLWHFVVGPTGSVLFSEHLPLLRLNLLLLRLPPSVRPPLFTHISISLFFHGSVASSARSRHVVILTAAPQAYILLLLASMRTYVLLIYICIHITYYFRAYIYICIYIYEHIATRAHTYTYTIFLYVYSYIYTQLHIYYIIVLYVSEKERPVDYGRSAFLMSE